MKKYIIILSFIFLFSISTNSIAAQVNQLSGKTVENFSMLLIGGGLIVLGPFFRHNLQKTQ